MGASRTDSGAHAEGQVCHFDVRAEIPPENWVRALNRVLPNDVRAISVCKVSEIFHSRFCALDRKYRYTMYAGRPDPRKERFAYPVHRKLDLGQMRKAAALLEGEHDFRAFTEELGPDVLNTRRTLRKVSVWKDSESWHFDVLGTAFLKGMMRRMAGAVLEVGLGRRPTQDIETLLDPERRDRLTWPVVLPAKGLTLLDVRYGPHPKDNRDRETDEE